MEPSWDDPDDDGLEPHGQRNPLVGVIAVLLVISLVLSGVAIVVGGGGDDDSSEVDEPVAASPTTVGEPPTAAELDAIVAELSAFVSEARGLEFTKPVPVTLLADAEFSARVEADAVDDIAEVDETEGVLRALGLLDDHVDLAATLTSFLGDGVVGFYDPESGELVVRGAVITPYVRLTLTHELTHALDDQHFELHRPQLMAADDEAGAGFAALVEGNAVRIEEQYRDTLSADEQDQANAEQLRLGAGVDFSALPPVIPALIGFPYVFGPALVDALVEAGGEARVNEAFRAPPTTTEQVLDPAGWLAGDVVPVDVAPPSADGDVFDEGVFGLWGIVLLLQEEIGQADAVEAARGWGGDWYVAWFDGDDVCVRATFEMDSPDDVDELESAFEDWSLAQDDAEVVRSGEQLTLQSCG